MNLEKLMQASTDFIECAQRLCESPTFDLRHTVKRAEALKYIAGIYHALLVAKEAFRRNPINLEDAELVLMPRPSSKCQIMHFRYAKHELRWDCCFKDPPLMCTLNC